MMTKKNLHSVFLLIYLDRLFDNRIFPHLHSIVCFCFFCSIYLLFCFVQFITENLTRPLLSIFENFNINELSQLDINNLLICRSVYVKEFLLLASHCDISASFLFSFVFVLLFKLNNYI